MKAFITILVTLFIISMAAKATPFTGNDPYKNEKATPSKNVGGGATMSSPNHTNLNEADYIRLKHNTDAVAEHFLADQLLVQPLETRWERSQRISKSVQQQIIQQSRINHYPLNEGEYIIYKRLKLIM